MPFDLAALTSTPCWNRVHYRKSRKRYDRLPKHTLLPIFYVPVMFPGQCFSLVVARLAL